MSVMLPLGHVVLIDLDRACSIHSKLNVYGNSTMYKVPSTNWNAGKADRRQVSIMICLL